jgi:polysaccharide pyruvyl transferase WcaK-like protein
VVPDLAFGLPREQLVAAAPLQWPPRVVALGVMGYRGWNAPAADAKRLHAEYLDRIERLARFLLADGLRVRLIHGDTRADLETVSAVAARLRDSAQEPELTAAPITRYADAISEIGQCDLVVATRYHNLLFGLLLGRPVVSIGYGDKNEALLADFGLEQYACHVESFDPARLRAQICALAALPTPPTANVTEILEAFRRRVDEQYDAAFGPAPGAPTGSHGRVG